MQIILSILQFIGIALLVLLGIIVCLILLILFYPICYTVEGELYSEKTIKAKVSWLFHLIRAKLIYEDDVISAKVGIFWKTIPFSYEFETKNGKQNAEHSLDTEEVSSEVEISEKIEKKDTIPEIDVIDKQVDTDNTENNTSSDALKKETEEIVSKLDENRTLEYEKEDSFKGEDIERDNAFSEEKNEKETTASNDSFDSNTSDETKHSFIEKIKGMISKIKGTINKITQVWNEIKTILTDKQNQSAVKHIKDEGIYLLKIFLPVKSSVNGVFSTGSPDTTGQVFGIIALFPFMYENEWSLRPDFTAEKAYFEGSFYAKGRIYLYKMVLSVLRILFDRNCRRLYRNIKRFMQNVKEV